MDPAEKVAEKVIEKAVDDATGVAVKVYDDVLHPSTEAVGVVGSLLPRTVRVWFSKWEKWLINKENSIRLTAESVREKCAQIPEEKLTEPEPYVALPAIEHLSYCYDSKVLRELYAKLLVSAMNLDTRDMVHPAFVETIHQMSPVDAIVFQKISQSFPLPCVTIQAVSGYGLALPEYYIPAISNDPDIEFSPPLISMSISNLSRLGLIDNLRIPLEGANYQTVKNDAYIVAQLRAANTAGIKQEITMIRRTLTLNDFGRAFSIVCL